METLGNNIDIFSRDGRIPPNMFIQLSLRRTRRSTPPFLQRLEVFDLTDGAIQDCMNENVN